MRVGWLKTFFLWDLPLWLPRPIAQLYCRIFLPYTLGVWIMKTADPLDQSQAMPVACEEPYKIQSREEHDKKVRRIWWTGGLIGFAMFAFMLGMVIVMNRMGYESKDIVSVQLILVYIFVPVYGLGFVASALATSLLKMGLGVEMSREGLDIGKKTVEIAENVDKAVGTRLKRADALMTRMDNTLDALDRGEHALVKVFRQEMTKLRAEIRNERERADGEIAEALEEGERGVQAPSDTKEVP